MKNILTIIIFLIFNSILLPAQSKPDSLSFPQSWQGEWKGDLEIYNGKGLAQSLPMELHILPMDTSGNFVWRIIYVVDSVRQIRNYELQTINAEKGEYLIDEKNTILLEGYLLGGKFFQRFEVMGSLLMTSTEKINENEMIWEIISGSLEAVSKTGGTEFEEQEIPPVRGYKIDVMQRAKLKKME